MKITILLAGILLVTSGCGRKTPTAVTVPPAESARPAGGVAAVPADPPVAATKEQIGSCVRVRLIAGALPVKNLTGAILDRQELQLSEAFFDQNRCVVALLQGWTAAQLRSEQTKILIFRNLPDGRGEPRANIYPGKLLQFDEKSGIALFTYFQGFTADLDQGFRIERTAPGALSSLALRSGDSGASAEPAASSQPGGPSSFPSGPSLFPGGPAFPGGPSRPGGALRPGAPFPQALPALSIVEGKFRISAKGSGELEFPPGGTSQTNDEAPLIAGTSLSLLGFAREKGGNAAEFVGIPPLQISVPIPTILPVSASFGSSGENSVQMTVKFERKNGAEKLSRVMVRKSVLPPGTKMDVATLPEPFAPIADTAGPNSWIPVDSEDKVTTSALKAPAGDNQEVTYIIQLAWSSSNTDKTASAFSRPFLVKLTRSAIGITAATEGVTGPADALTEQSGQLTSFALEAPVVRIFEIAEGREVLMQMLGDPFWKRFSMEKKEWLPLPAMNSSTVDLAGNRTSLFVLDRSAGEVRRYRLSDLKLLATAKLNLANEQLFAVRAGSLSEHAPIHVLCSGGPVSFDAETLQRLDYSDERAEHGLTAETAANRHVSGDGVTLSANDSDRDSLTFRGNVLGLRRWYFDASHRSARDGRMVSAAFNFVEGKISTCALPGGEWKTLTELPRTNNASRIFTFQSAPVIARFLNGNTRSIPPVAPRMELFSLWKAEPIADFAIPELAQIMGVNGEDRPAKHLLCIDLSSRRIGILSPDQKTWSVRDFQFGQNPGRPVLSNWPDSFVHRGGEFRFKPLLLGEGRFSAELLGTKVATPVTVDQNGIAFRVAENELASLLLLNLSVAGKEGSSTFSIPIYVGGEPLPFIWPDLNPGINPDEFAAGFKSLIAPKDKRIAVKSAFYSSPDRVVEILAPTDEIVALVTDVNRVDFLALGSHKLVGSIPSSENTKFYAGGDALFEYDNSTRTLTRISVPDGSRGASLSLPPNVSLEGIVLPKHRDQPMSLFLMRRQNERSAQAGNLNFMTWQADRALAVVSSETLQSGGWMQPNVLTDSSNDKAATEALNLLTFGRKFPARIVGSQNGSILQLRNHFGFISPGFSLVAPYPEVTNGSAGLYFSEPNAEGSITGIVATNTAGLVSRNGLVEETLGALGTPCGRYVIVGVSSSGGEKDCFEVRSIEHRQPLFRLNRLAVLRADHEQRQFGSLAGIQMLGENGPAVIRSRGGKLLQFVELDIPRLAMEVAPESFHVTSQPLPVLFQGGTYEYQVKVNNPEWVTGYKLRLPSTGATITAGGMLRFSLPQETSTPARVPVSIEIAGKNGSTVLHSFSVVVISRQSPPSPPPPGKPPQVPPTSKPEIL